MAITPDEIENRVFSLVRRGYDPAEVDTFLKDVATSLAQAQGGLATPAPAPTRAADAVESPTAAPDPDDFGRLGEEVASILRQAHESVATLRHRGEADAALIRQQAERDAEALRVEAEADRSLAAQELQATRLEAEAIRADIRRQVDQAGEAAATLARQRSAEVIEAVRIEARGAVAVQRNVRGRLEGTRGDIDLALDRLVEEDEDLFETIDLTDAATAASKVEAQPVPPPGQGPPSPGVPVPPRAAPVSTSDLPYATHEEEAPPTPSVEDEPAEIDLTDEPAGPTQPAEPSTAGEAGEDDPLAQMVKNAVENALRRRKGDDESPDDTTP